MSNAGLVRPCDIKGILHSHSRYTDGAHALASMAETARNIGLEYLGISDHYQSEFHPDGLTESEAMVQRQEIQHLREQYDGFDLLHGVEIDVLPDGELAVDDGALLLFDYVIVSFPEIAAYDPDIITDLVVNAAINPQVTILGHPVGECMLHGETCVLNMDRIIEAAVAGGTALEINANPNSMELDWSVCKSAQDRGAIVVISPNAHRAARLVDFRHGAELANSAGLYARSILNTMDSTQLRQYLNCPTI